MDAANLIFTDKIAFTLKEWLQAKTFHNPVFICDENTFKHCFPLLEYASESVIVIPAGENSKNFQILESILEQFLNFELSKQDVVINLGGGVVSDLGGFAASIYRRGISYINIPTTLLAMADAAIGGKTGIDFKHLKNYIGSFKLPQEVFISIEFLDTLPQEEQTAAMAEVIKTAIIYDKDLFEMLVNERPLSEIIHRCAHDKAVIVNQDFEDKHIRQLLNFGHTIGHAYESMMLEKGTPVLHGFAIAKGMLEEIDLAKEHQLLDIKSAVRMKDLILNKIGIEPLTPDDKKGLKPFLNADKKNISGCISFSMPTDIGAGIYQFKLKKEQIQY